MVWGRSLLLKARLVTAQPQTLIVKVGSWLRFSRFHTCT